jgi:hypothetical protein
MQEHLLKIFFQRHVDQILLCTVFAVTRYFDLTISFKEILEQYRKQPQCSPQISARINMRNGQLVNVVVFYNDEFVQAFKYIKTALEAVSALSIITFSLHLRKNYFRFLLVPKSSFCRKQDRQPQEQ